MSEDRSESLRKRAEEILHGEPIESSDMSPQEIRRMLYELQIHEVELELQNEELREAQQNLEESSRKYTDLYDYAPVGYLTINRKGFVEEANLTITKMLSLSREHLFQYPFASCVVASHRPIFYTHHQKLFDGQSPQRIELQLIKGTGEPFYAQLDSSIVLPNAGEPHEYHTVVTDISQRKQFELAEYEQRLFAESLAMISVALNKTLDLAEVLSLILENVNYVVQHDVAEVMLFENGMAVVVGSQGITGSESQGMRAQMKLPIKRVPNLVKMLQSGRPVIIPDIQRAHGWMETSISRGMRAYVGVPIHLDEQVIGCLNVFNVTPDFYTQKHVDRLEAFAGQAATAIKNAQLYQQVQEAATLQERQRLARDLHDAVSQSLFSASVIAESLPRLYERKPEALETNLDKLLLLTRGAMAEMRALLLELRPGNLDRYTLSELLLQLSQALQGRKQIMVHLQLDDDSSLSLAVKEAIYRVAQEALNNVIKHSQASEVSIVLDCSPHQLDLTIHDNGRGFDPQHNNSGMGLASMHERANAIHADLQVESAPHQGTLVKLIWHRWFTGEGLF